MKNIIMLKQKDNGEEFMVNLQEPIAELEQIQMLTDMLFDSWLQHDSKKFCETHSKLWTSVACLNITLKTLGERNE